jgi:hypothetical protein
MRTACLNFGVRLEGGCRVEESRRAMQNAGTQKIAELQANKLRELLGRAKVDKLASDRGVKTNATEVGGVFRMAVGFEWRDSARSVNFSADKPAALVFP